MAFAANYRHIATTLLVIATSSVLVWFGNDLDPWWPLFWFAPLPLLLYAPRTSWFSAALATALSLLIGSLSMWHYFHLLQAPWFAVYSTIALVFALAVLLFRALLLRNRPWSALLALPATWVSTEYLANLLTPHGTAGSLAYTQLKFLPVLQLASITGPWGISFLLLLFPTTIAIGLHLRCTAPGKAFHITATGLGVIALVLIFGGVRLAIPSSGPQLKVGLIASDIPSNVDVAAEGPATQRLLRDYAGDAEQLAARGAKLIILPEKLGVLVDPDTKTTDTFLQSLADSTGSTIVVGVVHVSSPFKYNEARIYAPFSSMLSYHKHHMLPPFESNLKPGTTLTLMPSPMQNVGIAICKDMDFTQLSRRYGQAGAGLMLVPAWDFNLDRSFHGYISLMRGVEDGFSIARAAKQGYLTVSDDRGRILAENRSDSTPFATLLTEVPAVHHTTLYQLLGDWFAWFSITALLFTIVHLFRPNRQQTPHTPSC